MVGIQILVRITFFITPRLLGFRETDPHPQRWHFGKGPGPADQGGAERANVIEIHGWRIKSG